MVTTPTFWSDTVTFSNDIFAFNPKVAALDDNSFAIVWGNGLDLFGRHLDNFGSFTGGNFLSSLSAANSLELHNQQVFQQSNGELIVNFSRGPSGGNIDVLWHQVNQAAPNSTTVNVATSSDFELLFDSDTFGNGSAVAYRLAVGATESLQLRYLNASGATTVGPITVGAAGGDLEDQAAIAGADTGGGVVVAYRYFNVTTFASDIRMRVFNSTGVDSSGEVIVSGAGGNFPDVTLLGNGGLFTQTVVTWQDAAGIAYRHYIGGIPVTSVQVIPGTAGAFTPQIVTLKDLGYIIAWTQAIGTEGDGSPDLDIVLQRFDIDGDPVGGKVFIDEPGDQALFGKSLAVLDDGRVVIAFENETGDSTGLTTLDYVILDPRENTINGDNTANNIVGRLEATTINGLGGDDELFGMDANDLLIGGAGADDLDGGKGIDTASYASSPGGVTVNLTNGKGSGSDAQGDRLERIENVTGSQEADRLVGDSKANLLRGSDGKDELEGRSGKDTLKGGDGKDILTGGPHRDLLYGDDGKDDFDFNNRSDSKTGGQRDKIQNFKRGQDDIDLRDLDAKTGVSGNQKFKWIGKQDFHDEKGELRYKDLGSKVIVQGDVNGDGKADFEIWVAAGALSKADFLL